MMTKFFSVFLLSILGFVHAQNSKAWQKSILNFQKELNNEYSTKSTTPLRGDNFKKFIKHPFFKIDNHYKVEAQLVRPTEVKTLEMPTSSGKSKYFTEYATAYFVVDGKNLQLTLYTNNAFVDNPKYKNNLFVPFRDLTNNKETYGGGRYLDLEKTDADTIIIDFNKAYQPYCAYNATDYSCPIVPENNKLDVAIKAGVMYDDVYHH